MKTLRLILCDQLNQRISSLQGCDKTQDIIMLCEVKEEMTYVKHHKKKIALLFSAMRHFAAQLEYQGFQVDYVKLDDPANTGSLTQELRRALARHHPQQLVLMFPSEYRLLQLVQSWQTEFAIPVIICNDDRFLCSPADFAAWAQGRKQLRMEYFYREMRVKHDILMQGSEPEGGQWNYDADNRKPAKPGLNIPKSYTNQVDAITQEVLELVQAHFADHFGELDPFYFAVTRRQALKALALFIKQRLAYFGDYQDAMLQNEPWLYHSQLSFYLNCGLLLPLECVLAAEQAYYKGHAPLNAVEGFIRQIIGWREYVRGVYWLKMPHYAQQNYFNAKHPLPNFFWTARTELNCLRTCITETKQHAYAHHIQRLMVLGNFMLLAGVDPKAANEWYWIVYADAYEWVELPNVSGMILFADGGYLASKPYAAGGSYIQRMSDYCQNCRYKVSQKTGPNACPFNYLYWDFLIRNRNQLAKNPRLGMMYQTLDNMNEAKIQAIRAESQDFLNNVCLKASANPPPAGSKTQSLAELSG